MARPKRNVDLPFPWRCGNCGQEQVDRVNTPYTTTISYDGRFYNVVVPDLELPTCANCGEVVFDNHTGHQINRALRRQLGLLQPEQIRAGRTQLGLNQRDFAAQLGAAEESVSRWETGAQVQSRGFDRQIRLFFALPDARNLLARLDRGELIGETVQASAVPRG